MSVFAQKFMALAVVIFSLCWSPTSFAEPKLNGISTYTELGAEQFIAGLYTDKLTSEPRAILLDEGDKRMEVRVIAGYLLSNRFKRMWIEGVAINASPEEMKKHSQHLADFSNMLAIKLQRDDILSIVKQNKSVLVLLNNIELGQIQDRQFFDILLRTWIGPVPLSSGFREGLLTAGKINDKQLSTYTKVVATPERIAAIKTALATNKNKPKIAKIPDPAPAPKPEAKPETGKTTELIAREKADKAAADAKAEKLIAEARPAKTVEPKTVPQNPEPKPPVSAPPSTAALTPAPGPEVASLTPAKPASVNDIFEDEDKQETADSVLVEQLYISKLSKRTASFVKYPPSALEKDQSGSVRLVITINRSGAVTSVKTTSETEFALLNQAAKDAATKAAPYPPIPPEIKKDSFVFTVPIAFRIQQKKGR